MIPERNRTISSRRYTLTRCRIVRRSKQYREKLLPVSHSEASFIACANTPTILNRLTVSAAAKRSSQTW